jgi:hypothetical protein
MSLFWLSFVDEREDCFLGACVVAGADVAEAFREATRLGCAPDPMRHKKVQIASLKIPFWKRHLVGPEWRNRLLTREEAITIGRGKLSDEQIDRAIDDGDVKLMCPRCAAGICSGEH